MMNNHIAEKKKNDKTMLISSKIEKNLSLDEPKTLHQDQLNAARVHFLLLFLIALFITFLSLYIYILYINIMNSCYRRRLSQS